MSTSALVAEVRVVGIRLAIAAERTRSARPTW